MSLVEIVHHNEVIYTILDKPPPEPPKTPSRNYLHKLPPTRTATDGGSPRRPPFLLAVTCVSSYGCTEQKAHRYYSELEKQLKARKIPPLRRTFGYAETPVNPPDQFLKKGEGIGQPVKKSDHHCLKGNLPPVPKRPPPEKKEEKPKVNFKVLNIKKVVKVKGKPVEPRLVDTRDGHIKNIKGSGEVPEYCLRPDFGRLPAYLVRRNRRVRRERDAVRLADEQKESLCKQLADEEREKLLKDLKQKWQLMQKAFLQLPMLTDTVPKILKKVKMEQDLRQLEKDIQLVESNPYIYIYD